MVQKLKPTKNELKAWANFNSPSASAAEIRNKLIYVQKELETQPLNTQLQFQEAQLQLQLAHWLALEEDHLRQKSRESWLN